MAVPAGVGKVTDLLFHSLRNGLWHFRKNGIEGWLEWRERKHAEARSGNFPQASPLKARKLLSTIGLLRRERAFVEANIPQPRPQDELPKVGVILDEFSTMAFQYEWNQVPIPHSDWLTSLDSGIDLLFVESAWKGNGGQWQYQLTGANGPKNDFIELVSECRRRGIPTVFWNKEDPVHFNDFKDAAELFDHVFTTDESSVQRYRTELGISSVAVLEFAAQPRIHNPVRSGVKWHQRGTAFAGMYFTDKYPERREQFEILLGGAEAAQEKTGMNLVIFSRALGGASRYQFPEKWRRFIFGALTYPQMLTAYKEFKAFLNVNSVPNSDTMFARRVFEIVASGTRVVSGSSKGIVNLFGEKEVPVVHAVEETSLELEIARFAPELVERELHRAQRKIWAQHTYRHRALKVIEMAGIELPAKTTRHPNVTFVAATMRPGRIYNIIENFSRQRYLDKELVIVTHGFELDSETLHTARKLHHTENLTVIHAESKLTLGECLNRGFEASSGEVLSKMDDDDYYGPEYIQDLIYALNYSGSDLVGKQAHYMFLANRGVSLLRFGDREHKYTNLVMGPTVTMKKDVFAEIKFNRLMRGEDTDFLTRVGEAGGVIYSADRFNFSQYRGTHEHTWIKSEAELLAKHPIVSYGDPTLLVTL